MEKSLGLNLSIISKVAQCTFHSAEHMVNIWTLSSENFKCKVFVTKKYHLFIVNESIMIWSKLPSLVWFFSLQFKAVPPTYQNSLVTQHYQHWDGQGQPSHLFKVLLTLGNWTADDTTNSAPLWRPQHGLILIYMLHIYIHIYLHTVYQSWRQSYNTVSVKQGWALNKNTKRTTFGCLLLTSAFNCCNYWALKRALRHKSKTQICDISSFTTHINHYHAQLYGENLLTVLHFCLFKGVILICLIRHYTVLQDLIICK